QAFVERNLVVPTPSGVELRPERSQAVRERHLEIRVNVFEILPPNEATRGDLFVDASKAFPEELRLPFREDADRGEHLDVGEAPRDVVTRQPSVDRQGDDEPRGRRLHVRRRGSASRPLRLDRGRHSYFALFAAFTSFVEAGAFAPAAGKTSASRAAWAVTRTVAAGHSYTARDLVPTTRESTWSIRPTPWRPASSLRVAIRSTKSMGFP